MARWGALLAVLALPFSALARLPVRLPVGISAEDGKPEAKVASGPARHLFRISGVVVSSRDGAPVPHCQLEVSAAGADADRAGGAARREREPRQPGPGSFGRRAPGAGPGAGSAPGPGSDADAARDPEVSAPTDKVVTDAKGHFLLTVAHAGLWRLRASAKGFRLQYYDAHETYFSAVALTDAAPEASLTFRLVPESAITGTVFDEAGEPVRDAQVRVQLNLAKTEAEPYRTGQMMGFSTTDDRGHYELSGLGPGDYSLTVQARPWYASVAAARTPNEQNGGSSLDPSLDVVYPVTWYPGVTDQASAGLLTLHGGEERQVDFNLVSAPAIHLRIPQEQSGAPAPEDRRQPQFPSVISTFPGGVPFFAPSTRADGNVWDVGGLSPGTYQVRTPGSDGRVGKLMEVRIQPGSGAIVSMDNAVPAVKLSVHFEGAPDAASQQIVFVNADTGQSYPLDMVRRLRRGGRRDDDADDSEDEDADKTVRTVLLPPHRYEVKTTTGRAFITSLSATGAPVQGRMIDLSNSDASLIVHLATGFGKVSGTARREGSPSAGAMVLLVPASFGQVGSGFSVLRDETNTDGSFNLGNVVPGPYLLLAIENGWGVNWEDATTLAHYLIAATPLEVKSSASLQQDVTAQLP